MAPYPPKFKALTLYTFEGKGSPNQHIYYFKSQTGNVVSNNAIMARLFIGTLKEVAMNGSWNFLPARSKYGPTSRSCFWLISLKTIQKFLCKLSLQPSKRKESLLKSLLKDFRAWHSVVPVAWPILHWLRHIATICKLPFSLKWEWQNVALESSWCYKVNRRKKLSPGSKLKKKIVSQDLINYHGALQSIFSTKEKRYSGNGGQVTFKDPVSQR